LIQICDFWWKKVIFNIGPKNQFCFISFKKIETLNEVFAFFDQILDEDTMSAVSEETTTLLTKSTNSSTSNLSFDSKNSQK
jgi:hypothetical protein